jgi:hypothetical protein
LKETSKKTRINHPNNRKPEQNHHERNKRGLGSMPSFPRAEAG